jgi:hypothetical protein
VPPRKASRPTSAAAEREPRGIVLGRNVPVATAKNPARQPASGAHSADLTQAVILTEHADEIRRLGKRVVTDVIEIGARLTDCKRICGHGNWLPWLEREFGWTEMTATRLINVYEMSKSNNLLDLELPLSGLYLLAAPGAPQQARDAIIERAQAGEPISVANIKQTIDGARRSIVTSALMHAYAERGLDLYETPEPATRALLKAESFGDGTIWECANGRGAMSHVLRAADADQRGSSRRLAGARNCSRRNRGRGLTIVLKKQRGRSRGRDRPLEFGAPRQKET